MSIYYAWQTLKQQELVLVTPTFKICIYKDFDNYDQPLTNLFLEAPVRDSSGWKFNIQVKCCRK